MYPTGTAEMHGSRFGLGAALLDRVLHDLKQPLNQIRVIAQDLRIDARENRFELDSLAKSMREIEGAVDELVARIEQLRSFARPAGKRPLTTSPGEANMKKLLLIGESLSNDNEVGSLVQQEEYAVITAATGSDGLGLFRKEQPPVVVLERELADIDGVDLLKQLCEEDPACAVILVTSAREMEAAIEVLRAGAVDYLRRPIDTDALRLALGRARERRQQSETIEPPTILVIEDHEATRTRVARVLEKEGYRVLVAADGVEGLELVAAHRLDLILADVRMPRKDGITVLREAKSLRPDIEVIVVTGYGDEDIVVEALRQGAVNFLKKPIDIEQMLLAIQKAIDFQNTRRSLSYRNRDIVLMQELVLRLTKRLELIVEAPDQLSPESSQFLRQLVGALPFGVFVVRTDRSVVFSSHPSAHESRTTQPAFRATLLASYGITDISEQTLESAFERALRSEPGVIETVATSQPNFVVMTPIRMRRQSSEERLIAVAVRGRSSEGP